MGNNIITKDLARYSAMNALQAFDPRTYSIPSVLRVDGKWTAATLLSELLAQNDLNAFTRTPRVKNTTGLDWDPGTLLQPDTLAMTPQPSQVATNSPSAGAGAILLVPSVTNFEVGQVLNVTSNGYTDTPIVAAVSTGQITVDRLLYNQTLPTVTALPAYEAILAEASGANIAEWVVGGTGIADGEYGWVFGAATVGGLDTSAFTVEQFVYLSSTPGTYQSAAPEGDYVQQVVGVVKVVDAGVGEIIFFPELKRIISYSSAFLNPGVVVLSTQSFGARPLPARQYEPQSIPADALSVDSFLFTQSFGRR